MRCSHVWMVALALGGLSLPLFAQGSPEARYQILVALDKEFAQFSRPTVVDGITDYSPEAIQVQKEGLEKFRQRLAAINTDSWSIPQQVDYLLVWAKLNNVEFDHRVMKPWARDPLLYHDQVSRLPYTEVPVPADKKAAFAANLRAVPAILKQAQDNLTESNGELAKLTIFYLENFDGLGIGQPYRSVPPAGTVGWYKDLGERLQKDGSDLVGDCQKALAAVEGYRDWLKSNLGNMPQSAAIGLDNINWYLKHVRLLPYDVDDIMLLGGRELHRFRFDYVVERNKNRELGELALTQSAEEHERRTRNAETRIRATIKEQNLLTIPDYMPPEFETDAVWTPVIAANRHFWVELQFRNALNNHIHASIPGHRFDRELSQRLTNPIRKSYRDTARGEGWGTYLEELFVQAGTMDDNPRARELNYIALIKRGSRVFAETGMHSGKFSIAQANQYMIDQVPFMEVNLGRYDLIGYLRRPGDGSMYLIGKMQIEQLVSERALQLGDKFDLGTFHDDFLSKGVIPVTLIRWEMTGYDDEVKPLWAEVVDQKIK